jgi:DNA excision repair protein ERCC-3
LKDEVLVNTDDVGRITDRKVAAKNKTGLVKRQTTTTKTLAGGDNMAYMEYNRTSGGQFAGRGRGSGSSSGSKEHHVLFKKYMGRK